MSTTRREFLTTSLATTAACGLARSTQAINKTPPRQIVDTHVYIGHWPHRRLPGEEPKVLIAALRQHSISHVWLGSFDGLFHKDVAAVNARLAETCSRPGNEVLIPFGTINPALPDWEEDIRRCHETFHMPGIRLHPTYHGYTLADPRFSRLLELAAARGLIVQLVSWTEDERHLFLNPRPAEVDPLQLVKLAAAVPALKLVIANGCRTVADDAVRALLPLKQIYFDFARAATASDIRQLVAASRDRIVFGSCAPLHTFEPVAAKMEQAQLADDTLQAITSQNAERLVATKSTKNRARSSL